MVLIETRASARLPFRGTREFGLLLLSLAVLPVAFFTPPAAAPSQGSGSDQLGDGRQPAAITANAGAPVVANVLWRVRAGAKPDLMSTVSAQERDSFPLDGQIFYVPSSRLSDTTPLYRLFESEVGDHKDSATPEEGGYRRDAVLGYAFTSNTATRGTSQLVRTMNASKGDHGLINQLESPPPGYDSEPMGLFAWPRYLALPTSLLSLSAGGVTIESNAVAGGALWHWYHAGAQYINNRDYGRQIQAALFFQGKNPTEAGDTWSDLSLPPAVRHGSPAHTMHNSGTTQATRAIPLEWNTGVFAGAGPENPVVWKDLLLGKNIELNFNNLGPVAKYSTVAVIPEDISEANIEIPTGYLKAEFNRFWTYDATSRALVEVFPTTTRSCDVSESVGFAPNFGGVIISDETTGRAMAVYGVHTSRGGSVSSFRLFEFFCVGDGSGEFNQDTSKFNAVYSGRIGPGVNIFNTWLMSGPLVTITRHMDALYLKGVR